MHDWTDHVWVEVETLSVVGLLRLQVFIPALQRWCHSDPCESAFDSPMMYEAWPASVTASYKEVQSGWGKKLTYCISTSPFEVRDSTRRYTRNYAEVLQRRREVPEAWLQSFLVMVQTSLFQGLPDMYRSIVRERQLAEAAELAAFEQAVASAVSAQETKPRQSGSLAWRRQRGEMGSCTSGPADDVDLVAAARNALGDALPVAAAGTGGDVCQVLLGAAYRDGSNAVLTKNSPDQVGSAWAAVELSASEPLAVAAIVAMPGGGADGMAVLLSGQEPALGIGGCSLGFGGCVTPWQLGIWQPDS